ncbi:MAG: energy transducer TonB [Bacteroidota bacterium]
MAKKRSPHVAKPVYPGGMTALKKFVAAQLRYPEEALRARVEGTVTVRYGLDYRGKVVEAKVKKGLGHGCDEEALRVVKLLEFNVPQNRKKKVRIHQDLNIHFKLPAPKKEPTPAPSLQIRYSTNKAGTKKSSSYGYTISW